MFVSDNLETNKRILSDTFKDCGDIIIRPFKAGYDKNIDMLLVYIDNIVSTDVIENSIMTNLMNRTRVTSDINILDKLMEEAISIGEISEEMILKIYLRQFFWEIRLYLPMETIRLWLRLQRDGRQEAYRQPRMRLWYKDLKTPLPNP